MTLLPGHMFVCVNSGIIYNIFGCSGGGVGIEIEGSGNCLSPSIPSFITINEGQRAWTEGIRDVNQGKELLVRKSKIELTWRRGFPDGLCLPFIYP